MKVLVIGGGGREHTIVWKLKQSKRVEKIYCIPGNGGIAQVAECVNLDPLDFNQVTRFVEEKNIELTIVGPEAPLVAGIVDAFRKRNLAIFGPDRKAAQLEGSKIFAKNFMKKYNIPTADFEVFDNADAALVYLSNYKPANPFVVVKADGLAAGKGALVCDTKEQAVDSVKKMMVDKIFGLAGERIAIEERLSGEEATVLALCDGETLIPMPSSQDHKPVFDGDKGPNTGGMGAYAPAPIIDEKIRQKLEKEIFANFIKGINEEKLDYRGIIYFGLMITKEGPKVLEFNCRYGDPEAQVTLPLLDEDLIDLCLATIEKRLSNHQSPISPRTKFGAGQANHQSAFSAVCVVLASSGYPGEYKKGKEIFGLDEAEKMDKVVVFHAGTKEQNGKIFTNGGRVLGVTGLGENIEKAIKRTYQVVEKIRFEGMHYRKDIGAKALKR